MVKIPRKVNDSLNVATACLAVGLHLTGTLLGPIDNLERLGMPYSECK